MQLAPEASRNAAAATAVTQRRSEPTPPSAISAANPSTTRTTRLLPITSGHAPTAVAMTSPTLRRRIGPATAGEAQAYPAGQSANEGQGFGRGTDASLASRLIISRSVGVPRQGRRRPENRKRERPPASLSAGFLRGAAYFPLRAISAKPFPDWKINRSTVSCADGCSADTGLTLPRSLVLEPFRAPSALCDVLQVSVRLRACCEQVLGTKRACRPCRFVSERGNSFTGLLRWGKVGLFVTFH